MGRVMRVCFIICLATKACQQCCQQHVPLSSSSNKIKHTQQTNAKKKKTKNEETKYEKTNRFKLGRSTFECNCYLWAAAAAAARPATIGSSTRGQCGSLCALSLCVCVYVCVIMLVLFGSVFLARAAAAAQPKNTHTRDSCSVTLNSIGFCNDSFWVVRVLG